MKIDKTYFRSIKKRIGLDKIAHFRRFSGRGMLLVGMFVAIYAVFNIRTDIKAFYSPLDKAPDTTSTWRASPGAPVSPFAKSSQPTTGHDLPVQGLLGDVSPGFLGGYQPYQEVEKTVLGQAPDFVLQYTSLATKTTDDDTAWEDFSAETENKSARKNVPINRRQEKNWIPEWISIPVIGVDAPVVAVELQEIEYLSETYLQWSAPDFYAAGWHRTSAPLGVAGNTVLNGHHNIYGEVFRYLNELQVGDLIFVKSGQKTFSYQVESTLLLPERFKPVEQRLSNAQVIDLTQDERLTLITCWPYESNTHRVVVLAAPFNLKTDIVE